MKKCSLLLLFCCIAFCSIAQNEVPQTNFVTKSNPDEWKTMLNRHEFSLGWSDDLWSRWTMFPSWLYKADTWYMHPIDIFTPNTWLGEDIYYGPSWTLGTQSLSYMFRVKKWFWVGCDIIYTGWYTKVYDLFTDELVGNENVHSLALMPKFRFSYLNRKHVMLYSGFSLGFDCVMSHDFTELWPAFQWTILGVKAGADWFGFAELGWGNKGFGAVGVGYHFNSQRNKSVLSQQKELITH